MYTIYISTFGKKTIKIKDGGVQIEVGASRRTNFKYALHDNTGDNISNENEYYGELTGMYWIWKNTTINDDDIIGFCHYNKALNISRDKAISWIKSNNNQAIITLPPIAIRNHPAIDEVSNLIKILKNNYNDCYRSWNKLYDLEAAAKGNICRGGNMFITSGKIFKEYCSWLFPILSSLRNITGDKPEVDPYMRRYCAYMGERLLSVYIKTYNIPVLDAKVKMKKWWIPFLGKIRKNLGLSKKSTLYKILLNVLGNNSQYGKRI